MTPLETVSESFDLEAITASVFPGASIVASDDEAMVVLLHDRLLHLTLMLRPGGEGWRAWLCWDGDRVREGIATHTDPAEALRLARAHLETTFATLISALAPAPTRLPASLVRTMDAILARLLAGESAADVAADYTADDDPVTAEDLARFEALALAVTHEAQSERLAAQSTGTP